MDFYGRRSSSGLHKNMILRREQKNSMDHYLSENSKNCQSFATLSERAYHKESEALHRTKPTTYWGRRQQAKA